MSRVKGLEPRQAPFGFAAASSDESIVYGAKRPGFNCANVTAAEVSEWLGFMSEQGIGRVVCLLPEEQLRYYANVPGGLLGAYAAAFGPGKVVHQPVADFTICDRRTWSGIIQALRASDAAGEKVVVHCSGGIGRTGHVLAAWLVHGRGYSAAGAIEAVRQTGRNPREAVDAGLAPEADLIALLDPSTT
jgi:protein-tyrosine phosphatase